MRFANSMIVMFDWLITITGALFFSVPFDLNVVLDFYTTDPDVISPVKNIVLVNASIPVTFTIPIHTVKKGKTKLFVNGTSQLKIR